MGDDVQTRLDRLACRYRCQASIEVRVCGGSETIYNVKLSGGLLLYAFFGRDAVFCGHTVGEALDRAEEWAEKQFCPRQFRPVGTIYALPNGDGSVEYVLATCESAAEDEKRLRQMGVLV